MVTLASEVGAKKVAEHVERTRESTSGRCPSSEWWVNLKLQPIGRIRNESDGARRYRVAQFTFDTRPIQESADVESWIQTEFGPSDLSAKVARARAIGSAPFSVFHQHNVLLEQIRIAFIAGAAYPALVGSCALVERIYHELVLALREDFLNHSATTKPIRNLGRTADFDWKSSVNTLAGWGAISDDCARMLLEVKATRDRSVHFYAESEGSTEGRALDALTQTQAIVDSVFGVLDRPDQYIEGTPGEFYFKRAAEELPVVKRVFLPRCVLVGPLHKVEFAPVNGGFSPVYFDDEQYGTEQLTDEAFAIARHTSINAERG